MRVSRITSGLSEYPGNYRRFIPAGMSGTVLGFAEGGYGMRILWDRGLLLTDGGDPRDADRIEEDPVHPGAIEWLPDEPSTPATDDYAAEIGNLEADLKECQDNLERCREYLRQERENNDDLQRQLRSLQVATPEEVLPRCPACGSYDLMRVHEAWRVCRSCDLMFKPAARVP